MVEKSERGERWWWIENTQNRSSVDFEEWTLKGENILILRYFGAWAMTFSLGREGRGEARRVEIECGLECSSTIGIRGMERRGRSQWMVGVDREKEVSLLKKNWNALSFTRNVIGHGEEFPPIHSPCFRRKVALAIEKTIPNFAQRNNLTEFFDLVWDLNWSLLLLPCNSRTVHFVDLLMLYSTWPRSMFDIFALPEL